MPYLVRKAQVESPTETAARRRRPSTPHFIPADHQVNFINSLHVRVASTHSHVPHTSAASCAGPAITSDIHIPPLPHTHLCGKHDLLQLALPSTADADPNGSHRHLRLRTQAHLHLTRQADRGVILWRRTLRKHMSRHSHPTEHSRDEEWKIWTSQDEPPNSMSTSC